MENLNKLLPIEVYECVKKCGAEQVNELRLRVGKPLIVNDGVNNKKVLNYKGTANYICRKEDIDFILGEASGHSVYAVNDEMIKGYLTYDGGIRIGVCGEGVLNGKELSAMKNIGSMTIRVPRQVFGCAADIIDRINKNSFKNTLIVSPPAAGKTTMLREIARLTSLSGKNVLLIDERYELSAPANGVPTLEVGTNTDVVYGVPKIIAYENTIRAMNPEVIITDEVYSVSEAESLLQAIRAGVKVAASIHAESVDALEKSGFGGLVNAMEIIVFLSRFPAPGTITGIVEC